MESDPNGLSLVSEEIYDNIRKVQSQPPTKTILMANYLEFKEKYDPWFEKAGYKTVWTEDGLDILTQMSVQKFDVVILNLMLNTIDGLAVIKALRKKAEVKIPIVVLTTLVNETIIKESFTAGVNDFLIMSEYTPEEVMEKIREVVDVRG